jgi:carbamoyltransferase
MRKAILGISAYYHDSAAAILVDGKIIAAAQEERFTRIKHDASFPEKAIRYVLDEVGISMEELSSVVFYEKPMLKFERLLESYHAFAPKGLQSFITAMPIWIKEKLFMKKMLKDELSKIGKLKVPVLFTEHHLSHAASAFFPSPYQEAAILTIDGVGEFASTTISKGKGKNISILKEIQYPHSLGLLYSAFTYYCGFKVNSGEYKLMGLAPYGQAESNQIVEFIYIIKENLIDILDDGSFLLNMDYFQFATGLRMTYDRKWTKLFGIPPRKEESEITQDYMDLALAVQIVTEEIVVKLVKTAKQITGCENLTMAGGVALNCVANGKLLKDNIFNNVWVQPAAGDAGGAVGAALAAWHIGFGKERNIQLPDGMNGSYLGPEFSEKEIAKTINRYQAKYIQFSDFKQLTIETARLLDQGNVIGWFQGRMEFGPRALGNRSILGDARNADMQRKLNLKIKYREGFRPFAPAVLEEKIGDYFDLKVTSPYMLMVAPVNKNRRYPEPENYQNAQMLQRLYHQRSDIPAVTHIDYSARIQSVNATENPRFHQLIESFRELTDYGVIVNTSFNVRGEPIVCTPDDAYRCFMATEMDYLVMGDFLFKKDEQTEIEGIKKGAKNLD